MCLFIFLAVALRFIMYVFNLSDFDFSIIPCKEYCKNLTTVYFISPFVFAIQYILKILFWNNYILKGVAKNII